MENVIYGIAALVAIVFIWRYATKKVKHGSAGRSVVVVAGASAQGVPSATFGTVIAVNVICLIGMVAAVVICLNVENDLLRVALALSAMVFFPIVAFKFLESQDRGKTYSLIGALAAISILFWIFGGMWYLVDIVDFVRDILNG